MLLALLLAAFALLLLAFETYLSAFKLTSRDTRLLALGLYSDDPALSLGMHDAERSNYLRDLRYFWPVIPLSVLVAYSIAFIGDVPHRHVTRRFLRQVAALYMFGYVGMSLVYLFFLFMPGTIGDSQRQKVMAGSFEHWPSMAVTYEYSAGRRFVLEQLKEDPRVLVGDKQARRVSLGPGGRRVTDPCNQLRRFGTALLRRTRPNTHSDVR